MALRPISRPTLLPEASLLPQSPKELPSGHSENRPKQPPTSLSQLANTLSLHGGGSSSGELALDIILNELVHEARSATNSTGAAIALVRDGVMVCRATTGVGGPNLGMRLSESSGLSGIALQTREVQLCDDAETDARVDQLACRDLGIRSVLVIPIEEEKLQSNEHPSVLGVFETFSSQPHAFSVRDIELLKGFRARIISYLAPPGPEHTPIVTEADKGAFERDPEQVHSVMPVIAGIVRRQKARNSGTTLLMMGIIICGFLLGWLLGAGNWRGRDRGLVKSGVGHPSTLKGTSPGELPAQTLTKQSVNQPRQSQPTAVSAATTDLAVEPSSGGLVVYEKGKVIFRTNENGVQIDGRGGIAAASAPAFEQSTPQVVHRVEPVYPEGAKQQHIQGPVEVATTVGKTGMVEQVRLISGDPILAAAVTDAISKWRFKPLVKNGRAADFTTRIKVEFKLR